MKGLIFTYLLGYGGAAVALFNPLVGLFVYVLFSIVRPQLFFGWAGDLSGMSFVIGVAMLAGWALKGFGDWRFGRARPLVLALAGFMIWYCASAWFASDQALAWGMVRERLKVVLPFLVGITIIETPAQLRAFAWLIVLAHGYVGYEMNMSYLHGFNRAQEMGLLGDNNSFAISMVAALGPAMFLGLDAKRWWQKAAAFASAAAILHTVQLTFSRGGMLSMIITGAVVLVVMPKKPTYLLGVLVAVALAVRLTGPQLEQRFLTTFASAEERDGSAQSRIDLWQTCLTMMAESPLVGIGPYHFPRLAHQYGWTPGKQAHSTWMQTGAEIGIPGLAFLLSFYLLASVRALGMARERHPDLRVNGMYVFSGLLGFIVAAQFVSMEGLEVPYYIVLVGAVTLKLWEQYRLADVPGDVPAGAEAADPVAHEIGSGVNPEWERRFTGHA